MSHAHHFLSRLDRVSMPHIELALSLYNDADLLRFILSRATLPEGAPRVAISLDHPERGPFLVVTREGRFVTCLGEGMTCGDLPVVTRGQLDGIAAKAGDLRVRMEACQQLAGKAGGVTKLLRRLYEAGDELSREEFIAISALQPLYVFGFVNCLFGAGEELCQARERLLPHLRRSDRLKPELYSVARAYWNTFWAVGHLSVLMAMEGPSLFDRLPGELGKMLNSHSVSWAAVRQGVLALALKGSWAAARLGKGVLPTYKRLFHEATTELTVIDAGMTLVALGTRHTRLRAEVSKVLAGGPDIDPLAGGGVVHTISKALAAFFETAIESPEEIVSLHRHIGARACVLGVKHLPRGAPMRFERAEDVPDDLAMTLAVNLPFSFIGHEKRSEALFPLFGALPWVARAKAEDLYLPREFIKAIHSPWKPEYTCDLLRHHRDHYKHKPAPPPPRSEREPTRNGPCACGSGKKFKRCCGAAA